MNPKIEVTQKITVKIGDQNVEISSYEAETLYSQLRIILNKKDDSYIGTWPLSPWSEWDKIQKTPWCHPHDTGSPFPKVTFTC